MEEYLYERIARRMWEGLHPGVPWDILPMDGMKARMRSTAMDIVYEIGVTPAAEVTVGDFKEHWSPTPAPAAEGSGGT